jgi:hypothetical protein
MHNVIKPFAERLDGGYRYVPGDTYPRNGITPPEGRVEALCVDNKSNLNATGDIYLEAVAPRKKRKAEDGGA